MYKDVARRGVDHCNHCKLGGDYVRRALSSSLISTEMFSSDTNEHYVRVVNLHILHRSRIEQARKELEILSQRISIAHDV